MVGWEYKGDMVYYLPDLVMQFNFLFVTYTYVFIISSETTLLISNI